MKAVSSPPSLPLSSPPPLCIPSLPSSLLLPNLLPSFLFSLFFSPFLLLPQQRSIEAGVALDPTSYFLFQPLTTPINDTILSGCVLAFR